MTPASRLVPLVQLVPPPEPLRVSMGDEPMERLKQSILQIGILYPLLAVRRYLDDGDNLVAAPIEGRHKGAEDWDKLEIVDGHRRYVAAVMLELVSVPVLICDDADEANLQMMLDANVCREDVTPFEEGVQFLDLATKHQWSIDQLMTTFGKSEDYINDRIDIVRKDAAVAEAVRDRKINLGQAKEVLRCADPAWRPVLLEQAAEFGASIKNLREMRHNHERDVAAAQGEIPLNTSPQFVPGAVISPDVCAWCGKSDNPQHFVALTVHQYELNDLKALLDKFGYKALLAQLGPSDQRSE